MTGSLITQTVNKGGVPSHTWIKNIVEVGKVVLGCKRIANGLGFLSVIGTLYVKHTFVTSLLSQNGVDLDWIPGNIMSMNDLMLLRSMKLR